MVLSCGTCQIKENKWTLVKYVIYAFLLQFQFCRNFRNFSAKSWFPDFQNCQKNRLLQLCTCPTHCAIHSVHFTLCTTHCALHTVNFTLRTVYYTLCTIHYALSTVYYKMCTAHCTPNNVNHTVNTKHWILDTAECTLDMFLPAAQQGFGSWADLVVATLHAHLGGRNYAGMHIWVVETMQACTSGW